MGNRGGSLDKTRGGVSLLLGIPSWKEERCVRWSMMRRSVENRKKKGKKELVLSTRWWLATEARWRWSSRGLRGHTLAHKGGPSLLDEEEKKIDVIYAHDLWFESRLSFFANSLFDAWMVLLGDKFLEWRYQEEG